MYLSSFDAHQLTNALQIEFCLKEWSSGSCQHSKLDESVEGPIYANFYLPQVEEWIALDPDKVKKKLQRWYLRARCVAYYRGNLRFYVLEP